MRNERFCTRVLNQACKIIRDLRFLTSPNRVYVCYMINRRLRIHFNIRNFDSANEIRVFVFVYVRKHGKSLAARTSILTRPPIICLKPPLALFLAISPTLPMTSPNFWPLNCFDPVHPFDSVDDQPKPLEIELMLVIIFHQFTHCTHPMTLLSHRLF